jgi:hypothetical protein
MYVSAVRHFMAIVSGVLRAGPLVPENEMGFSATIAEYFSER